MRTIEVTDEQYAALETAAQANAMSLEAYLAAGVSLLTQAATPPMRLTDDEQRRLDDAHRQFDRGDGVSQDDVRRRLAERFGG